MKKIVKILGVIVIALNLFFSFNLDGNLGFSEANAILNEGDCERSYPETFWSYRSEFLSTCYDSSGNACGSENYCEYQSNSICAPFQCILSL